MRPFFFLVVFVFLSSFSSSGFAQRKFGFDNRKPSGQPYLKPAETVKKFKVTPGYHMELFAGEPDVINPIAFTVDERGRIWVVECFEYPKRTPKGKKPRDRIKILEDTNNDGKCDKVTIWAQGKDLPIGWDLASGIEVGNGGVYLGAPPYLFFLEDTDGDNKCDKQTVLLKGFGSQDTHETLNTFQWGPDSKLYGLHGVFTQSKVGDVRMNAAVWRYDPPTKKFEVFAEGTSNPWGMDFDSHGQCHLVCCVIPHMFHMVPGGTYIRQAGFSFNPYAYGLLKQSCDHTHHKESGWAHAGLLYLDGDHVPEAYRGSLIMGSIHGCSIKRDDLRRNKSTFVATHAPDFVVSGDKNVRPINLRWAPDGSIYWIDWHDQNPCHQAKPDSWDKERGRIYRIVPDEADDARNGALNKLSAKQLVPLLKNDNPWWYRTALRLLHEKKDVNVENDLHSLFQKSKKDTHKLRALWGLYAIGKFDDALAKKALRDNSPWVRSWAVRFLGEGDSVSEPMMTELITLAKSERAPEVRLQLASSAQRIHHNKVVALLHHLMKHDKDVRDPFIPLMLWLAYEPHVAKSQSSLLWLRDNAPGNPLVTTEIVPRTVRRMVATNDKTALLACLEFLAQVDDSVVRENALNGMLEALKGRKVQPPQQWSRLFAKLMRDDNLKVKELARKLAVNYQDKEAIALALRTASNSAKPESARISAIRDLGLSQPREAMAVLLKIVRNDNESVETQAEAIRALSNLNHIAIADNVLTSWKSFSPRVKSEAVNLLSGRREWARTLLAAVEKKHVAREDLDNNAILRIRGFKDGSLNKQIEKVWGSIRKTPQELDKLIVEMRKELTSPASFARGRKVFETNCAKCHKFAGKGFEVGPPLDGASRDIEYLLANVLDPNRVVGEPYFTRFLELKNGRIETGLLHAEDKDSYTLKGENNNLKVILKKDVASVIIQKKSLMPEGLTKNMSKQDFRDLIRYVMAHPFVTEFEREGKTIRAGVFGELPIPSGSVENDSTTLKTDVIAETQAKTKLLLGAETPVDVHINGKKVYSGRPGITQSAPDQIAVDVTLQKGRNQLHLVVRNGNRQTSVFLRFLDPNRILTYPEAK